MLLASHVLGHDCRHCSQERERSIAAAIELLMYRPSSVTWDQLTNLRSVVGLLRLGAKHCPWFISNLGKWLLHTHQAATDRYRSRRHFGEMDGGAPILLARTYIFAMFRNIRNSKEGGLSLPINDVVTTTGHF